MGPSLKQGNSGIVSARSISVVGSLSSFVSPNIVSNPINELAYSSNSAKKDGNPSSGPARQDSKLSCERCETESVQHREDDKADNDASQVFDQARVTVWVLVV